MNIFQSVFVILHTLMHTYCTQKSVLAQLITLQGHKF